VYALIKFLRLEPFDDKTVWTEYVGGPVKFGQALGVARLQTIMKCITLRRTKETKASDGTNILSLPPRRDELRFLKFDEKEQQIYDGFFDESKAEFNQMSENNEVMKNYVGILQKILRLRQICDHFELVRGKGILADEVDATMNYDEVIAEIAKEGINVQRGMAIFAVLRESGTAQCVECGYELAPPLDAIKEEGVESEEAGPKRGRKHKASGPNSRVPTRQSSPTTPRLVLTRCQHLFCIECFRNCICPGWPQVPSDLHRSCSACQAGLTPLDAVELNPEAAQPGPEPRKKTGKHEKRQKGMPLENLYFSTKVKALLGDLAEFSKSNPNSHNYDPDSLDVQMVDEQGNCVTEGIVKTVVL
jgi:SWI/SNF-related matrix-associated actin-dependent regulator of chromatin subfamily A3